MGTLKTGAVLAVAIAAGLSVHAGKATESVAGQQITKPDSRTSIPPDPKFFTGNARIEPLFTETPDLAVAAAYVYFEPGSRSAWHAHPAGQRLVVTAGVGRTQEWGKPVQEIRAGDVVICPPGVKHWHGASPGESMTHLVITGSVNGKMVDWFEKVTDAQYLGR